MAYPLLNIALMPKLVLEKVGLDIRNMVPIRTITLDIHGLIDDYKAIVKIIDKNIENLYFADLIVISDWLYEWYKKNDHYILSNRVLDSFRYVLSMANNARETIK